MRTKYQRFSVPSATTPGTVYAVVSHHSGGRQLYTARCQQCGWISASYLRHDQAAAVGRGGHPCRAADLAEQYAAETDQAEIAKILRGGW